MSWTALVNFFELLGGFPDRENPVSIGRQVKGKGIADW